MASLGSKVLQTRSVELAMNYRVKVQVLSTFDATPADQTARAHYWWMRRNSWNSNA